MPVIAKTTPTALLHELADRQNRLYEGPDIDGKLEVLIQGASTCTLSWWDIHRLLRTARAVYFDGALRDTPIYDRAVLPPGFRLEGPAVIEEFGSTTVVFPRQLLDVDPHGILIVRSAGKDVAG